MQGESKTEEDEKKKEEEEKQDSQEPLDKSVLDNFTENLFPGCLALLDTLPETVYRVCELLIVVTQRNGQEWQNMVLSTLVTEVSNVVISFVCIAQGTKYSKLTVDCHSNMFTIKRGICLNVFTVWK